MGGICLKNAILVIVLFVALVVSTAISDYAYSESVYNARIDEQIRYMSLDADRHAKYSGFTVEQLGEGYINPDDFLGKVLIDVPVINQFPELPVGCEIASAVSVLNYIGYDIDKTEFTEKYITWDDSFKYDKNDKLHGPDPYKVFAGDPFKWGYGCYAPVLTESINRYFEDTGSSDMAIELNNVNIADLEKLVDEGVPVIVWASQEMMSYKYKESASWVVNGTSEEHQWLSNTHVLVFVGYDTNCYYFMDCNDKTEIMPYSKQGFINRWTEQGSQSIVIKIQENS